MRWVQTTTRDEGRKTKGARGDAEHRMQVNLFKWAKLAEGAMPELAALFAVPNGGARHPAVAWKMKAEGVKPGVPDVMLAVSCGGYHGLWLELKAGKNRESEAQRAWIARLLRNGYLVQTIFDEWTTAKDIIERYLAGRLTREKQVCAPGTIEEVAR